MQNVLTAADDRNLSTFRPLNLGREVTILKTGDQAPNRAQLIEISETNAAIITQRPIKAGTEVRLVGFSLALNARVLWCRSGIDGKRVYHRIGLATLILHKPI